jgi:hypothetical protein
MGEEAGGGESETSPAQHQRAGWSNAAWTSGDG